MFLGCFQVIVAVKHDVEPQKIEQQYESVLIGQDVRFSCGVISCHDLRRANTPVLGASLDIFLLLDDARFISTSPFHRALLVATPPRLAPRALTSSIDTDAERERALVPCGMSKSNEPVGATEVCI